jgi:Rod binding domain-containing protein
MNVDPLQRQIVASDIAPEKLAGNARLSQEQKITEASRQFEAVLLRQILGDAQKTIIPSEFSDNSTAAGIYQDLITNTLANSISKSGAFGLAKTFEQQLNRPSGAGSKAGHGTTQAAWPSPLTMVAAARPEIHVVGGTKSAPPHHSATSFSFKQP